jgi:uncharacterized protein YkwD
MLKRITIVLFTVIMFSVSVSANEIRISVSGEEIEFSGQPPVIIEGRTLVPVRDVFEALGFEIGWDAAAQRVRLGREGTIVILTIGKAEFSVNGETRVSEVPAQIINGRTMLPVRAIAESTGSYSVGWDSATSTVLIEAFSDLIPRRRLTDAEISRWIELYNEHSANEFEREAVRLTNEAREAAGLEPLEEYAPLMMAARFKSQSMYELEYFNHTSPVYGHFSNISRDIFAVIMRRMGENLARGHRTPEAVVEGWIASEGHREHIFNPDFTKIGVGFYNNIWTQKFSD